jgi:exopolysaccharide biosynthesis polyprenyl glycosylphosphotransferase
MNRSNKAVNTNIIQMGVDSLVLLIVYFIERKAFEDLLFPEEYPKCLALVVVFGVIYLLLNKEARIYNVTFFFYLDRFWRIITRSWMISAGITMGIMYVYGPSAEIRSFHLHFMVVAYFALMLSMVISRFLQMSLATYQAPRSLYVGTFAEYEKFNYYLNKTSMKIEEVGYVIQGEMPAKRTYNILGTVRELENIIRANEIDQVFFIQHRNDNLLNIQDQIDLCIEMGVTVKVVMDYASTHNIQRSDSYVSSVGTYPVITYHTVALNSYEQMVKRLADVVFSALLLLLFSPIMLITAIAIKLDSRGPVLYKQKRVGLNGRVFTMLKFRSRYEDNGLQENDSLLNKTSDDPRITRVGRFIRRTRIDELPQLINVILGDMSLVGTRPPKLEQISKYKREQWRRISIKPGITGLWQISDRDRIVNFDEVVELDLKYIDNWTIGYDIVIMFKTIGFLMKKWRI